MPHTTKIITLKNGARGLLINVPDATVWEAEFLFNAGYKFIKRPELYDVPHLAELSNPALAFVFL